MTSIKPITFLVAIKFDTLASHTHYEINTNRLIYWVEKYLYDLYIQIAVYLS
jgi:hypothetical protein